MAEHAERRVCANGCARAGDGLPGDAPRRARRRREHEVRPRFLASAEDAAVPSFRRNAAGRQRRDDLAAARGAGRFQPQSETPRRSKVLHLCRRRRAQGRGDRAARAAQRLLLDSRRRGGLARAVGKSAPTHPRGAAGGRRQGRRAGAAEPAHRLRRRAAHARSALASGDAARDRVERRKPPDRRAARVGAREGEGVHFGQARARELRELRAQPRARVLRGTRTGRERKDRREVFPRHPGRREDELRDELRIAHHSRRFPARRGIPTGDRSRAPRRVAPDAGRRAHPRLSLRAGQAAPVSAHDHRRPTPQRRAPVSRPRREPPKRPRHRAARRPGGSGAGRRGVRQIRERGAGG